MDDALPYAVAVENGPAVVDGATLVGLVLDLSYGFSDTAVSAEDLAGHEVSGGSYTRLSATARCERIADEWKVFLDDLVGTDLSGIDYSGIAWVVDGATDADRSAFAWVGDPGSDTNPYAPSWPAGLLAWPISTINDRLLPPTLPSDAGKTALVKPDGSGWELGAAPASATVAWPQVLASPSLIGGDSTEVLSDADRVTAGLGTGWLDGTAGLIEDPATGTRYCFSIELGGTANEIVRTTVTGTAPNLSIIGGITRTAITGAPTADSADVLGGKCYYDADNDQLLMVTHTNRNSTGLGSGIWSCVGIAKSTDWGDTWSYLGDVVQVEIAQSSDDVADNAIGSFSPYVVTDDGYFVVFHKDQLADGTVVAHTASRCLLADFISDCAADTAPTFSKWDGTAWTEAGLGGAGALLLGAVPNDGLYDHVDVMKVPALGGYLMIATQPIGSTLDQHRVSFAEAPEGPWLPFADPWLGREPSDGVNLYYTMFGSDWTEPWVLQDDAEVWSLRVNQPTAGSWTTFSVDVTRYYPHAADDRVWTFDHAVLVSDLSDPPSTVLDWLTQESSAVVTGDTYLVVADLATGTAGMYVAGASAWVRTLQPPIRSTVYPSGSLADSDVRNRWAGMVRIDQNAYYPTMSPFAAGVNVDASGFTGNLSATDRDLQTALETIDAMAGGGGVALGETSTTAYRGDRGKTAYDHSQVTTGNPHGTTAADVAAIPATLVNAKGDLVTATADDTPARLAAGTNGQMLVADSTTATGLAWVTRRRAGYGYATSGNVETLPAALTGASVSALTSGRVYLVPILLEQGEVVSNITFISGTTAAGTPTNQWFALCDSGCVVLAVSADDTTTAWGSSTAKTLAMGSAYTVTASGTFYLACLVAAATPPTLRGSSTSGVLPTYPAINGNTGLTSPPSVSTDLNAGASAGNSNTAYAYVT